MLEENPGEEPALGVAPDLEASPVADVGAAAVGPDDEAGLRLMLAPVVLKDNPRRPTGLHSGHPRAAPHLRARIFRRLQQDVLHLGVVVGEDRHTRQAGRGNVTAGDAHAAEDDVPPAEVVADWAQQLLEAQALRLGHAPRHQHLAADAVAELERALEHEDTQTRPGEQAAEPGPREPAADRHHVVGR